MKKNTVKRYLLAYLAASLILSLFMASCSKPEEDKTDTALRPMLFEEGRPNRAIGAGNLLYRQTLASDGKSLFYRSKDGQYLLREDFNSESPVKLSDTPICSMGYAAETIFYIKGNMDGSIYKIKPDGSGEIKISDITALNLIATESYIFYRESENRTVHAIRHDGTGKTVLSPADVQHMFFVDKILYYTLTAEKNTVYMLKESYIESLMIDSTDFSEKLESIVLDHEALHINIGEEAIYYSDENGKGIFARSYEGITKKISSLSPEPAFIVEGRELFYIDSEDHNRLYSLDLDGKKDSEIIINDQVGRFVILGNSIFYYRPEESSLYRADKTGGLSEKID